MKPILITGGAGFIGSNFIPYFAKKHPKYKIICLDSMVQGSDKSNLAEMDGVPNYQFVLGDICHFGMLQTHFEHYNIQGVIHFAAESHVDRSIKTPLGFYETNVIGTANLIEAARAHWGEDKTPRFHHISTDEVYGSLGETGLFTEATPYAPNSPYSASKAASDHIVRAAFHTYGMNITTSNCSNNYGPKQHAEKLIPTIIRKALAGEPIPIYGDGKNVRDWLYVADHCKAIDLIYHNGVAGEVYNVGGRNERNNLQIVNTICGLLDREQPRADGVSYKNQISFVADRLGHDRRYAIDATKLEKELSWRAKENFDTGIVKTIKWYLAKTR
ncbi:MAG: dTDP-glucose 4,6-dehydratase [Rickettsiales bacterium]|jgi:dTDP-glucose 4,6-dehydratase|nr:dTDP-glucose 4,6-dehydratase [Rickettsiales bacterium]